ncbi:MAG TPA: hypothetical protein VLE72_01570 [Candidatus Saccharimonadales bacterium]|nr:hypothetical protein [Candidatus Saccharimonadales bacterium]
MDTTNHSGGKRGTGYFGSALAHRVLIGLLIVVSILVIAAMGIKIFFVRQVGRDVKKSQYQALFLTNGQVYFGKLSRADDSYVKLTDIYYLQTQPSQPAAGSNSTQTQQLSLAKLGNELHGPEDVMYVAKSQVLFWENLKNDGKVVTAIHDSQKK